MRRLAAAVGIGSLGSIFIWLIAPYCIWIIGTNNISDNYLPSAVLAIILLLALGINPLLRRLAPGWVLRRSEMALILAMLLIATTVQSMGLLRELPYTIAKAPRVVREDAVLQNAYRQMVESGLPTTLFPDKITYEPGEPRETPVSDYFITELPEGIGLPWGAWIKPLFSWGALLTFCWLMMIGLALIVFPQWRQNERLAFPLLIVHQNLVEDPAQGRLLAPIFRKRSFWTAAAVVFAIHLLAGLNLYNPEGVPAIPLSWSLRRFFTEGALRYLGGPVVSNRLFFILIGAAFFMPSRTGFSMWFITFAYVLHRMVKQAWFPPYQHGVVGDHRMGAMWAVAAVVVWLGRAHWAHVFRCMVRRARSEGDRRDRLSGFMFVIGCAGMLGWLLWVGVQPHWALFLVVFAFVVSLVIARIVAETGVPFIRLDCKYQISLMRMAPAAWVSPVSLYMSYVIAFLFATASAVSVSAMGLHSLGVDAGASARRRANTAVLLVAVLLVGLVVCGASHLWIAYRHSASLDGATQPINRWGHDRLDGGHRDLVRLQQRLKLGADYGKGFRLSDPPYNQPAHIMFGALLAGGLYWACLHSPKWPLHPIGLLMVYTYFGHHAFASIFFGWLLKVLLLRFGGARVYRAAIPAVLGLMIGEVLASVFWAIEPITRVVMNWMPYTHVRVMP